VMSRALSTSPVSPRPLAGVAQTELSRLTPLGSPRPRRHPWAVAVDRALTRATDIVLASVVAAACAPRMALAAIAVRAESPGPALFRQWRVGRGGRRFRMWKFRTMVVDAEARRAELVVASRDPNWLHLDHDPRVTLVGRILRHTSLDELPQLFNVLRGEMTMVGPRPLIPAEHARVPAWARMRDDVKPGITGLWQVAGRTTLTFEQMLELDCVYVGTRSARRDLEILARTVPAVVSGKGAN
jgi:lipopolysaccharide/colanic/teichoic acid biosynthesis glycosyltransferase